MERYFMDNWIIQRHDHTYTLCFAYAAEQARLLQLGTCFKVLLYPTLDTLEHDMFITFTLRKDEEAEELFTLNVLTHNGCAPLRDALELIDTEEGGILITEVDW